MNKRKKLKAKKDEEKWRLERARIDKLNEDHNNRLLLMPVTKKRKKENDTTSNDDRIYATDPRFRAYSPVYD